MGSAPTRARGDPPAHRERKTRTPRAINQRRSSNPGVSPRSSGSLARSDHDASGSRSDVAARHRGRGDSSDRRTATCHSDPCAMENWSCRAPRTTATLRGRFPCGRPYAVVSSTKHVKENAMSNQIHPYEPLTSENAALVLVDHQVGLMTGDRDYSTGELKHNVVALAKAATALKLPIIVTTTARDSMWGPTFPELVEALTGLQILSRSTVNAWECH